MFLWIHFLIVPGRVQEQQAQRQRASGEIRALWPRGKSAWRRAGSRPRTCRPLPGGLMPACSREARHQLPASAKAGFPP